jgi:uncharacterized protein
MPGIKNLDLLLNSMKPKLVRGEFVFCTLSNEKYAQLTLNPLMVFNETAGTTLILEKEIADKNNLSYNSPWALITLEVHSDLQAVGFLAAITNKLAENGISVNAVSAYYHDHLFVPFEKSKEALKLLKDFSR